MGRKGGRDGQGSHGRAEVSRPMVQPCRDLRGCPSSPTSATKAADAGVCPRCSTCGPLQPDTVWSGQRECSAGSTAPGGGFLQNIEEIFFYIFLSSLLYAN
jgi:hypothetical protein